MWHLRLMACMGLQEATQRTIGQFDAAVLEIDTEEAEELARVCAAMQRLRVSACSTCAWRRHVLPHKKNVHRLKRRSEIALGQLCSASG